MQYTAKSGRSLFPPRRSRAPPRSRGDQQRLRERPPFTFTPRSNTANGLGGCRDAKQPAHFGEEAFEIDWLGIEVIAARSQSLVAIARHRMCGQGDDWNVCGLCVRL